jgi:outer membrane protein assembly factor BamD (BamD/ComL family)
MHQVRQFHAKYPQLDYENDTRQKQQVASNRLRELAGRWLEPIYQQLEMLRQAQKTIEVIS